MGMPTEEQMTASLLEAKDVTIAELRKDKKRLEDILIFGDSDAYWDGYIAAVGDMDRSGETNNARSYRILAGFCAAAFLAGLALAALVAGVW